MNGIASTPEPPYYAVVFTSVPTDVDVAGYEQMAARMLELAAQQPGFLGVETARGEDGVGITVSYWQDLPSIKHWRENAEHRIAQDTGKQKWYASYQLRICKVEAQYGMNIE